ncbi:hypothetical protein CPB85DRAFT_1292473 [Mucidula mucida]|nr:hypothetical protein CPB85DRAFT_1292473 [Mucidula mucida]
MPSNLKLSRLPRNSSYMGRIDTVAERVLQRAGPTLYHGAAPRPTASVQSGGSASSSNSSISRLPAAPRLPHLEVLAYPLSMVFPLPSLLRTHRRRTSRRRPPIQGPSVRSSHSLPVLRRSARLARASQNALQSQRSMTPLSQYNDAGPPGNDDMELEPATPASQIESLGGLSDIPRRAQKRHITQHHPLPSPWRMDDDGTTPGETMEAGEDSSMRVDPHGYLVYISNLGYPIDEAILRNYLSSRCGDVAGVEFRILGGSAEWSPFTNLPRAQMIAVVRFLRFGSVELAMRIKSPQLCGYLLSISPSPYMNPTTRESQERAANEGTAAGNVLRLSSNIRREDTFQT